MKTVKYQKDKLDQMTHTYIYDRANRLEEVFVSTDKIHQSRQAHYLYYDYGPLARVELGEQKVQGMDYAYTINGWMKAMNGTVLNPGYELGRDNASGYLSQNTSVHNKFARDVVGYTLGYFNEDYKSIGSTNFAPSPYTGVLSTAISQLYNGNIAYTTTAIADVPNSGIQMGIQMGVYRYDQMNRLVGARTFRASGLAASNSWAGVAETQEYKSTYSYDANGNLTHLQRNGGAANLNMDKFDYEFETVSGFASNRLDYVKDDVSYSANYSEDIDNQNPNTYEYDALGQLKRDHSEGDMLIEWFSGNRKVKKITRSGKTIEFKYNPLGQRIMKTVSDASINGGEHITTYYSYDANGQVMGVYTILPESNEAWLDELHIYGASRLGMIDKMVPLYDNVPVPYTPANPAIHTLGYKKYEITNYLGNVNTVITDRKLFVGGTYEAVVIMSSDYYPFGMQMPKRHTNEGEYRFGYNGMELDNEAKGNGNSYTTEFRQYDPRLGRWLSLDPLMGKYPGMSPYVAFNDNPIYYTDPLGLEGEPVLPTKNWEEGDKCVDENNFELTYVGNDEWLENINYDYAMEVVVTPDGNGTGWTRFWGVVQAVGGAIEAAVGSALIATGVGGPLGAILVLHGADQMAAGITQAATGESTETLTHRGARKIAETAGASKQTADNIATGVDIAYSVGGGAGAVKAGTTGPTITKVVTAEETTLATLAKTESTIAMPASGALTDDFINGIKLEGRYDISFGTADFHIGYVQNTTGIKNFAMTELTKKFELIARSHGAKEVRIIFTEVVNKELRDSPQWAAKFGFQWQSFTETSTTVIWSKTLK